MTWSILNSSDLNSNSLREIIGKLDQLTGMVHSRIYRSSRGFVHEGKCFFLKEKPNIGVFYSTPTGTEIFGFEIEKHRAIGQWKVLKSFSCITARGFVWNNFAL